MCKKCSDINDRIARYRELWRSLTDRLAMDGIDRLIANLEAQKLALHPSAEGQALVSQVSEELLSDERAEKLKHAGDWPTYPKTNAERRYGLNALRNGIGQLPEQ